MDHPPITFVGAGNMARSLMTGLIKNQYPATQISATNPHTDKLEPLAELGVHTHTDNVAGCEQAQVIVLAIKPHHVHKVLNELTPVLQSQQPLIISLAVGIDTTHIAQWADADCGVVRCMPNTPALIGAGMSGLFANPHTSQAQKDRAESIMRAVGSTIWLDQEADIDIVASISGSGPAYIFTVMEALKAAAVKLGLSREQAHILTLQTTLGAARLAMECGGDSLSQLRRQVTSKGGITEAALKAFADDKLTHLFEQATQSAHQRANELAAQINVDEPK